MDEQLVNRLATQVDETWSAEERAAFLGIDRAALRRSTIVMATTAFATFVVIGIIVIVGHALLSPTDEIAFPVVVAGVAIGAAAGGALSVCLSLLVGSTLAQTPAKIHQSIVSVAVVAVGFAIMTAALTLGGAEWLISVALGLTGWTLAEPAWQQSTVNAALGKPSIPPRALALLAAQRAELGLGGSATVLGVGTAREATGAISHGVVVICCAALQAISPAVGLLAALVRLLADLADVAALTTGRRSLVSVAPGAAAVLLLAAVVALY